MPDNDCRLAQIARSVRGYFFPRKMDVPAHVWELLANVYPTVDWTRVDFYRGWPHLLRRGSFRAITLPDPHSWHRTNIYFKPEAWQPTTRDGLSTIVHEGYHVLQMQKMCGGYGMGLVRPFLTAYLSSWARNRFAYRGHPMEEAAYRVAGRTTARFERHFTDEKGSYETDAGGQAVFQETAPERSFWQHMQVYDPDRFPGRGPSGNLLRPAAAGISIFASALWTGCWMSINVVLWVLWLIVEGVGSAAVGGLWLLSRIQCGIQRVNRA